MVAKRHKITNVLLFKKIWDIIIFFWDNNFLSHYCLLLLSRKK
jgi:hypothetical protein